MRADTVKSRSKLEVQMVIVCVKCGRILRIACNGVWAQENKSQRGEPYRVSNFDMWECPECGYQVLAGSGKPIYEYHRKQFEKYQKETEVEFW